MYHEGEIAVQERAGVREFSERIGRSIRAFIPPAAAAFLASQRLAIAGSVAADGRVWASALVGRPGFLSVPDEHTLRVDARITPADPLAENLRHNPDLGVLILDPATRRRMRVNGAGALTDSGLSIQVREVFSNCPKYIQMRTPEAEDGAVAPPAVRRGRRLTGPQNDWIRSADTFFLATHHAGSGADASHRGGMPGFIDVTDDRTLVWPDYAGNNMFLSLGNLAANPQAGLLFMDFELGATLQLTGTARVHWDVAQSGRFAGAIRLVEFRIDEVVETSHAFSERWHFQEYSPFNPRL